MSEAVAIAHANVALSKYWGKRATPGNFPAVPSLSVTLAALTTRTHVRFDAALAADSFVLGGRPAADAAVARVTALLDRVRAGARDPRRAAVVSSNDFPTSSGLASSASGFAALALAAVRAAGLDWSAARVSDLARRSSASAARSLFGGYVELAAGAPDGRESDVLAASPVAPPDHLPLSVLVAVVTDAPKEVGSTEGMRRAMDRSPYARAWLDAAPAMHARLREAVLARDLPAVGELAEASALAMHASAIAAGVVYWSAATLGLLAEVRALRRGGSLAYASIDAGPHVKVLTSTTEAARVREALTAVPGVRRVVESAVGAGARLTPGGEAS